MNNEKDSIAEMDIDEIMLEFRREFNKKIKNRPYTKKMKDVRVSTVFSDRYVGTSSE